jgi:hypothetical protein
MIGPPLTGPLSGEILRRTGAIWFELSCECWELARGSGDLGSKADTDGGFNPCRAARFCAVVRALSRLPFALTVN